MNVHQKSISHRSVQDFVNKLDIGEIHIIPGYCGAFRTITALTTMVIDLHLRSESLRKKLPWFNGIHNHFIVEFSDDGTPESKEKTMCIGSITMWNFGKRVRSRNLHYPIHTITAKEKDNAVSDLWERHTDSLKINPLVPSTTDSVLFFDNKKLPNIPLLMKIFNMF